MTKIVMMANNGVPIFDLDIEENVKELIKKATDKFKQRSWTIEACFHDDGDFLIELKSVYGGYIDSFFYNKSENRYWYEKRKPIQAAIIETVEENLV